MKFGRVDIAEVFMSIYTVRRTVDSVLLSAAGTFVRIYQTIKFPSTVFMYLPVPVSRFVPLCLFEPL